MNIQSIKVLLLTGSPKAANSTSASLGNYLIDKLTNKGLQTEKLHVCRSMLTENGKMRFLEAVENADVIVLSFPVYIDSLPAGVVEAFELMAGNRKPGKLPPKVIEALKKILELLASGHVAMAIALIEKVLGIGILNPVLKWILRFTLREVLARQKVSKSAINRLQNYLSSLQPKEQKLVAIANSGYPETSSCDTALAICEEFALEAGMQWNGGLALGGGAAIDGKPLEKIGKMVRNVMKSLDLAADDIATGHSISDEVKRLMAMPMATAWLYLFIGNMRWRLQAIKNGVLFKLGSRPFDREYEV